MPAALAVLLLFSLLAALAPTVSAHPPSGVSVEYLPGLQQLNVSITHVVFSADHYIFKVEVRKNDVLEITQNYDSQPTFTTFNYTYDIAAQDGDTLAATAYCIQGGDTTGFTVVDTGPPPDTISPTISIVRPSNLQVFNTSDIIVNGTASDDVALARVEVSLNNGTWEPAAGTADWIAQVTLLEGPNFIRARATDTSNNTNTDFVHVTFVNDTGPLPDTTPPSIAIASPLESQTLNESRIDVRGTASDENGVRLVEVRLNGGAWEPASGNLSWDATLELPEGRSLIEARATDFSNNTAAAAVNVTYVNQTGPPPDTVKPSIAIDSPVEGQKFDFTGINVTGTASDDVALSGVELRLNSGPWGPATGSTSWRGSMTLVNGGNRIDARATDTSGNTAVASVNVTYEKPAPPPPPPVDNTPPAIAITAPREGSIFTSAETTVNGTASDNVGVERVEVRVGSGAWGLASGNTTWTVRLLLSEGQNAIEARATDAAGNVGNASVLVTYAKPGGPATLDGTVSPGEYDHEASFSGGDFVIHWKVTGDLIHIAMTGRTTGWVAIGLEPTVMMKDADMIFGWVEPGGRPGMLDCFSTGNYGPHPPDTGLSPPGTNDILEYGGTESGGSTTIEFTRLLSTGDRYDRDIPANGTLDFIWALGPDDDIDLQHLARGYGSIDLTTGASTERAAMAWQPHAVLMSMGLSLLVAGMLVARMKTRRWWMKGHRAVMLAGAALTVAGLLSGFYMVQASTGMHLRVPHSLLGLLSLVMTLGMTASGLVVLRVARKLPSMRLVHRWAGRVTIVLVALTVLMGMVQAGILNLG